MPKIQNNQNSITAVINVHNESVNLQSCLKSIKDIAQEIIVVDMQSTDQSAQIAKHFGAKVLPYRHLDHVEPARNYAISKATSNWILLLDPDEYLGKNLKKELLNISQRTDVDYVKIPRMNIIFGKWLRHGNCWPDYLIRFFKKGFVTWKNEIHSQPEVTGKSLVLLDSEKLAIKHNNYLTVTHFIQRTIRYSNVQADELIKSGYKLKLGDFILKPIQEFNSRFFAHHGFKDGVHGLIFCLLQAFSVLLTYIYFWEKTNKDEKAFSKPSFVAASQESAFEFNYWFTRYYLSQYSSNLFKKFLIKLRSLTFRLTKNL